MHRSSNLDTQTPSGRNYTGKGIGVMVRDDATIGPHIDFQGRLDNRIAVQFEPSQNHGDGVAGIFSGAGNLDPTKRGMAAGTNVFNVADTQDFMDSETLTLINDGSVQITNTSSGFACNNTYSLNAVTMDQQTRDIPSLLHVHSGGNHNGTTDCGYGAGPGWGNIGGANKIAKNVIAAGNVTFDGNIVSNSAKGPALDGRIKPDLAAHGNGQYTTDENNGYYIFAGTSAASPTIAGVAAQLYEAYGDLNGGALPPSALIKAAMLNTAIDGGNIGPDFTYGWGVVNGLRAAKVLEDGRYLSDEIIQGTTNNHIINIPSGTSQVRFMVYWSDVPGALGASPALVNDLDLVVRDPSGNALLPWILDITPTAATLNSPATNGPDHLNNMEQVLINTPAEGEYAMDISGFNVPMGPQEYFLIYEVISDNITVTYPNGGESFVPGENEVIHWDAFNTTEDFNLEYSIDGGVNWIDIATVSASATNYVWSVPSTNIGAGLVRVSSGSFSDISDIEFSIAELVEGFTYAEICPDEITFVWDALAGAESYDVYLLGEKYMEVVGNSTTTSIIVPIPDPTAVYWAAIVAKNETENWTSRRTIAVKSPEDLLNCQLSNDLSILEIENDPDDFITARNDINEVIIKAIISNIGSDQQSNIELSYQLNGEAIVTETYTGTLMPEEQANYVFTTPLSIPATDLYTLTVATVLAGDQNAFNDAASLEVFALLEGTALDFVEDFEEGILPIGWSIINDEVGSRTWTEADGILGSDGNLTKTAFVDNYNYESAEDGGIEDFLVTEYFDLTQEGAAMLSFDLAKAGWMADLIDGLRVEISIDCGETFTSIYEKSGFEILTISQFLIDDWEPLSPSEWRVEQIDLTDYIGETVQFRFVNISTWGNNTYIDNIRVDKTLVGIDAPISSNIKIFPNPTSETIILSWDSQIAADASVVITNSLGQSIPYQASSGNTNMVIDVSDYVTGLYFITISSKGISETKKLIIE